MEESYIWDALSILRMRRAHLTNLTLLNLGVEKKTPRASNFTLPVSTEVQT
jgi:hypothetical protein